MKTESDVNQALKGVPLFAGLSDKSLRSIASQMKTYEFSPGSVIIEENTEGKLGRMYVILSGEAEVLIDGNPVAQYGPGDHFGEMSVLDGSPRSATIRATTDVTTMGLSSWNLRALIKEEPEISLHIIEVLVARLRAVNAKLND